MSELLGDFPRLVPKPAHTIAGIGIRLREGRTTCVEILQACLDQVKEWEPKVHAWVILDQDRALAQAHALDNELKSGADRGPLHGIPIGIKDIIDVAGLPTACGATRWANRVATKDALVVANLRKAGAVIMGKTVTTPYAWIDPPVTRNPWDLDRSPGGSSSGSAAAVACGMCLGAIGTQTGGSITRPASFCGVAGMKPQRNASLMITGIKPFAPSLDHVGPIAGTVGDLRMIFEAMSSPDTKNGAERHPADDPRQGPPRIGRLRGFFDRRAEPAIHAAFAEVVRALAKSGAQIVDMDDPVDFEAVVKHHRRVMAAEAAAIHSDWLDEFPADYPPRIRELIVEGRTLSALEYLKAIQQIVPTTVKYLQAAAQHKLQAVITPATVSTATDPRTTGDPAFNSPWSYMGLPTVSFSPVTAADGLPFGAQLIGQGPNEVILSNVAEWCEQAIRSGRQ